MNTDDAARYGGKRLPKGIHITEADPASAPGAELLSHGEGEDHAVDGPSADGQKAKPWGYLMIHNKQLDAFRALVEAYNRQNPLSAHECFVHCSVRRKQQKDGEGIVRGVVDEKVPTVSGLVFLQGETRELQQFLQENYPLHHLINDCSTGRPASIPDRVMRPFMEVFGTHPELVTFLREPFEKFARDHVKLRLLTGPFAGHEGYVVRVDRDRQLVMEFGGYTIAIRGVHKEVFTVAEEPAP